MMKRNLTEKNVLLITIDALRYDFIDDKIAPNLTKLSENGVRFTKAFAQGHSTRPSVAALLTSGYVSMFNSLETFSNHKNLAEILKRNGFKTIGIHSNPFFTAYPGYSRGFEEFIDLKEKGRMTYLKKIDKVGFRYLLDKHNAPYSRADKKTSFSLKKLKRYEENDSKLFFWIHYMDPHFPYLPPPKYLPELNLNHLFERLKNIIYNFLVIQNTNLSEEIKERVKRLYKGEIKFVDDEIGNLLENINQDEWITIITSDHGEEFWEHGETTHRTKLYDELIHVPLIINGLNRSESLDYLVSHQDIAPTILDLLDINKPSTFCGKNLFERNLNFVVSEAFENNLMENSKISAYRSNRYKLIEDNINDRIELYDLKKDSREEKNIVKEKVEITQNLLMELERFREWKEKKKISSSLDKINIDI